MILAKSLIPAITVSSKLHVLAGTTMKLGQPFKKCEVRVYDRATGVLLNSTNSNELAGYKIYVPYAPAYTIIAIDPMKQFNAVIQDNVVPK